MVHLGDIGLESFTSVVYLVDIDLQVTSLHRYTQVMYSGLAHVHSELCKALHNPSLLG